MTWRQLYRRWLLGYSVSCAELTAAGAMRLCYHVKDARFDRFWLRRMARFSA